MRELATESEILLVAGLRRRVFSRPRCSCKLDTSDLASRHARLRLANKSTFSDLGKLVKVSVKPEAFKLTQQLKPKERPPVDSGSG